MYPIKMRKPWEIVFPDIVGPLPRLKSGKQYIFFCEDMYSRFIDCFTLSEADRPKIARSLNTVVNRWGTPRIFLSDNGTKFVNQNVTSFMQRVGSEQHTAPFHNPQSNPVDPVNRNIKTMIASLLGDIHREWDVLLEEMQFAYNKTHSSLRVSLTYFKHTRELRRIGKYSPNINISDITVDGIADEWLERVKRIDGLRAKVGALLVKAGKR